ncbi:MAG: hypothetical protein O7G85_15855 [Planctomycetota bacterium]|nr:hypothetical protein [Planctomycetota bacterium]
MQGEASGTESVLDSRGQKVDLYHGAMYPLESGDLPRDKQRLFRNAGKWPNIGHERFLRYRILDIVVSCSLSIAIGLWLKSSFNVPIYVTVVVLMLGWIFGKSLIFDYEGKKSKLRAGSLVSTMLTECHCPSCAYNLRDLPKDEDGCTVCPECGSAWQLQEES